MGIRIALGAAVLALAFPVHSQKLPSTLTLTAYDTGSSGFNIAVAVGKTLKDKHGTDVRVLPAGNDVARLAPLKAGRAQASAMGIGVYFAQEGVFEFGVRDWGPQPLRLILSSSSCNAISLGVAKDTGVKQVKDLRGKRVGMVVGSPALNQNAFAILAFGGLTRNDVKLVEFSSYGAMWKGIVNYEVDAAIASTISGQAKEAEASPRGLLYPPTPHADKAGWEWLHKFGPYYAPHVAANVFFYDGLFWTFAGNDWYASGWYNGPWRMVVPMQVPVYLLRVPVRYYRLPPPYFHAWRADRPPRWHEHWGHEWAERRRGWDRWDHARVPPPAPLPSYQRRYAGDDLRPVRAVPQSVERALAAGQPLDDEPRLAIDDDRHLVPLPGMPSSFWVASTKRCKDAGSAHMQAPGRDRGRRSAPRDRGPEAGMYCLKGHY